MSTSIKTIENHDPEWGDSISHEPLVHYSYRVDGTLYESHRLFFGSKSTSDYVKASDSLSDIFKNKKITVYYDPHKPKRSVLQTGDDHVKPLIIFFFTLMLSMQAAVIIFSMIFL